MKSKCLFILVLLFLLPAAINLGSCSFSKPVSKPSTTSPAATPANAVPALVVVPAIQAWVMPNPITAGGSARLSWDVINATSVVIDQGIGSVPLSGSRQVSPDVSTTYLITAYSSAGTVSNAVTLTVAPANDAPPASSPQGLQGDDYFIGSTYTLEYHFPGCSIAKRITPPHKVRIEAWQNALDAGYHPCPVCKPPKSQ